MSDEFKKLQIKLQHINEMECTAFDKPNQQRLRFWLEPDGSGAIFLDVLGDERDSLWMRCQWGTYEQMFPAIDWYIHHLEYVTGLRKDAPKKGEHRTFGGKFGNRLFATLAERETNDNL
jgi:hypothetical protein